MRDNNYCIIVPKKAEEREKNTLIKALTTASIVLLITLSPLSGAGSVDDAVAKRNLLDTSIVLGNPGIVQRQFDTLEPDEAIQALTQAIQIRNSADAPVLLEGGKRSLVDRQEREEVSLAFAKFLDSGADAATNIDFSVSANGGLSGAPSVRVAILDWLGETDPQLAYHYSLDVLSTSSSSAEAAISLRNIGRGTSPGVTTKFSQLAQNFILNEQWAQDPSKAYFEGFDAIVFSATYQDLLSLSKVQSIAPRLTGFLAIVADNTITRNPLLLRRVIQDDEIWQPFAEFRPIWIARLNPTNQPYRKIISTYLYNKSINLAEKQAFLQNFPLYNRLVHPRLLTQDRIISRDKARMIDRQALVYLKTIRARGDIPGLAPSISAAIQRLEKYLGVERLASQ